MRRTEILQEIRRMRFEEVHFGWSESRLTQEEAFPASGQTSSVRSALRWRFRQFDPCQPRYRYHGLIGFSPSRRWFTNDAYGYSPTI
jgi:hypothetical protein